MPLLQQTSRPMQEWQACLVMRSLLMWVLKYWGTHSSHHPRESFETRPTHWPSAMSTCGGTHRFTRPGIVCLASLLEPQIHKTTWCNKANSTVQSVCMTLRFLAARTFLHTVGDANLSKSQWLSKATVCRETRRMCLALKKLLRVFVSFPGPLPTTTEGQRGILFNCRYVMIKIIYEK